MRVRADGARGLARLLRMGGATDRRPVPRSGDGASVTMRTGGEGMMRRVHAVLLMLAACTEPNAPQPPASRDVTASVERLGNPFAVPAGYARNVWDMQAFAGRVYVGHGDSRDNAGPIPIWSLDPATGAALEEFLTSEEQVD